MGTALVVCIGNDLAADDGAGHAVYHNLGKRQLPAGARLVLLGLGGMNLLDELTGEDQLIVVDAVRFGSEPGTVHSLAWEDIPQVNQRPVSGHGIGIREALEVGRRLMPDKMPARVRLVGIEGRCFDELGAGLSPEVEDAAVQAAELTLELLQDHSNSNRS